ncbi:MAG: hypothetical protein ABI847_18345, partial [Anaerolineales bacterium]
AIGRSAARAHLLDLYLTSVGAATEQQAAGIFRWRRDEAAKAANALQVTGRARPAEAVAGHSGAWWVTAGC